MVVLAKIHAAGCFAIPNLFSDAGCVGLMLVGPHIYHLSAAISWNAFCKAFATWNAETLLAKVSHDFLSPSCHHYVSVSLKNPSHQL